jgi:hypothetical protein
VPGVPVPPVPVLPIPSLPLRFRDIFENLLTLEFENWVAGEFSKHCADVSGEICGHSEGEVSTKVYEDFAVDRDQYNPRSDEATMS